MNLARVLQGDLAEPVLEGFERSRLCLSLLLGAGAGLWIADLFSSDQPMGQTAGGFALLLLPAVIVVLLAAGCWTLRRTLVCAFTTSILAVGLAAAGLLHHVGLDSTGTSRDAWLSLAAFVAILVALIEGLVATALARVACGHENEFLPHR